MKVLFVNENIGGHHSVHLHLREALREHHPDVEATFLDVPPPGWGRRLAGAPVPGLARLDLDLQPTRAQVSLSQWVRWRVKGMVADFDVVHVYTANAGLRIADKLAQVPSVVSVDATNVTNSTRLPYRNPTRFTPKAARLVRALERRVYDAATLVVANTEWIASSLRSDYHLRDDRLKVIPFGILAPDFGPGAAPGATQDEGLPQLVFVGRQLERKGALRLHRLHQQHLADACELVLVTPEPVPPGRNVRAVHDVTPESGKLWSVLREAAVFVFPSAIDQAPNVVIEAMAAGLPVVGIDIAAIPEMVSTETGRLVPPDDDDALVEVLRTLVSDAELRQKLGSAGREEFLARYDATVSTQRLVDVLREAIRRRGGATPGRP